MRRGIVQDQHGAGNDHGRLDSDAAPARSAQAKDRPLVFRPGLAIEEVEDAVYAELLAAVAQRPDGGTVVLSADQHTITVCAPSPEWVAADLAQRVAWGATQAQRAADLALLREHGATHPDPIVQAAARLLGA